jgi:hypothetical protein
VKLSTEVVVAVVGGANVRLCVAPPGQGNGVVVVTLVATQVADRVVRALPTVTVPLSPRETFTLTCSVDWCTSVVTVPLATAVGVNVVPTICTPGLIVKLASSSLAVTIAAPVTPVTDVILAS